METDWPKASIWLWENRSFFEEMPHLLVRGFYSEQYSAGLHIHDFTELNIITGGGGEHYVNGQRYPVGRGDIFVLPPGYCHGYRPKGNLKLYHVLLHQDFYSAYARELCRLPAYPALLTLEPVAHPGKRYHLRAGEETLSALVPQLDALSRSLGDTSPEAGAVQNALGVYIVGVLCRLCRESFNLGSDAPVSLAVTAALYSLQQRFDQKLDIPALCSETGLGRATLFRYFNRLTGMGPAAYLDHYRLRRARQLLCDTRLTVTEIAQACGYFDSAHFIRRFTRAQGVSPGRYRAGLREGTERGELNPP